MKKYAMFLGLTDNYTHLFNALFNSIELYGMGEYMDIYVVHVDATQEYIDFMRHTCEERGFKTRVFFVQIEPVPEDQDLSRVLQVKFYRYKLMAEIGVRYDAICFTDTDIFFCADLEDYFKIAANTDLIVGVNDNVVRNYKSDPNGGSCPCWDKPNVKTGEREIFLPGPMIDVKFICNTPQFIDMKKYGDVFTDVWEHRQKLGMDSSWPFTGDLETMNLVFNKHGVKDRLVVLGSHLWTGVHQSIYRVSTAARRLAVPGDALLSDSKQRKQSLFVSETCDEICAFHGRDWTDEGAVQKVKTHYIPKILRQMEGEFRGSEYEKAYRKRCMIFDQIQAYFLFLQFYCFVSLDEICNMFSISPARLQYMRRRSKELQSLVHSYR